MEIRIRPPTFSGKNGENIRHFFSKFEKFCDFHDVDERNKTETLGLLFEKEAIDAFDAIIRNAQNEVDYDIMKTEMINRYDRDQIKLVIRARIQNRKLQEGETVTDFFNEIRKDTDRLDMDDENLLFAFVSGLPLKMSRQIVCLNPTTSTQALEYAKSMEQIELICKPQESSALESIKAELAKGANTAALNTQNSNHQNNRREIKELKESISELKEALSSLKNEKSVDPTPHQQNVIPYNCNNANIEIVGDEEYLGGYDMTQNNWQENQNTNFAPKYEENSNVPNDFRNYYYPSGNDANIYNMELVGHNEYNDMTPFMRPGPHDGEPFVRDPPQVG